jgi:hypothetical protein
VELVEGANRYQTISTLSSAPFTPNSRFVKQISKWNDTRLQQAEVSFTLTFKKGFNAAADLQ